MQSSQIKLMHCLMELLLSAGFTKDIAFDRLLHFMAYKLGVEPGMTSPALPYPVWKELEAILDFALLREDPHDWIGDYSQMEKFADNGIQWNSSKTQTAYIAELKTKDLKAVQPFSVFDPCAASGGLLIHLYKRLGQDSVYFGAEPNVTLYRIALINMKLYNIPARIICADYRHHETNSSSNNWSVANHWTPPDAKYLAPIQGPQGDWS